MSEKAPTRDQICAVIVTYHPDESFPEVLARICGQVGHTIVVDNSGEANAQENIAKMVAGKPEVEAVFNARNLGQGHALNQGSWRAMELGYEWMITFDQDTLIDSDLVEELAGIWAGFNGERKNRLRVVGSNFVDATGEVGTGGRAAVREGKEAYCEVKTVITSGCLLALKGIHEVGPFREDFFIDSIDHEYCLRLRRRKFIVLQSIRPLMRQAIGRQERYKVPVGRLAVTHHGPVRRYYQARNRMIVVRSYFLGEPIWALKQIAVQMGELILVPILEEDKWAKSRAMWRGLWDGWRGRTGEAPQDILPQMNTDAHR